MRMVSMHHIILYVMKQNLHTRFTNCVSESGNYVQREGERRKAIEAAKRLLLGGKLSYEEIADAMGLSVEEVKALDTKRSA